MKRKVKTKKHGWSFLSPPSEERQEDRQTHRCRQTQGRNSTEHLKAKSFIYFVTTSYTFPESFHSDGTVTQDKSIQHMAIKAKIFIESTEYYCFPFKKCRRNTWILLFKSLHSPQPTKSFNRFSKWKARVLGINRAM